jgi:molybdopterin converting factor small subunit
VRIPVRLFANLARGLPRDAAGLTALEVPEGTTVEELVGRLAIPQELPRLVLVNGQEPVARQRLVPGDSVDVLPPLAGGAG